MDISGAREKYIFTTRIELEDGDYIVLREPTTLELREFGDTGKENVGILQKIFPSAIIEHSFSDGDKPAKSTQVAALLVDSGSTFTKIMNAWMDSLPLGIAKNGKSGK